MKRPRRRRRAGRARLSSTDLVTGQQAYAQPARMQAGWAREGGRILAEWQRTADLRHLRAFHVHYRAVGRAVRSWREAARRALPRRSYPRPRCVACGLPVSNKSLGGSSGRWAATSPVWCLRCGDRPIQLVLSFGGAR